MTYLNKLDLNSKRSSINIKILESKLNGEFQQITEIDPKLPIECIIDRQKSRIIALELELRTSLDYIEKIHEDYEHALFQMRHHIKKS